MRDMHGPGYNILPEELPPGVRCVRGQHLKPIRLIGKLPEADMAVFIGWHAAPDQRGSFSPHIFHKKIRWVRINGRPVTKVELFAGVLGEHGVPVCFVWAEDCVLERVEKTLPWIEPFPDPNQALPKAEAKSFGAFWKIGWPKLWRGERARVGFFSGAIGWRPWWTDGASRGRPTG
ncbi:MAG: M55 family metallopeptidase [Desulfosoma sp.]